MDFSSIWGGITTTANGLLDNAIGLLPQSPFKAFIDEIGEHEWLGYINWLIPIDKFIVIGESWLVAVGLFYLVSVILRWAKAIE